MADVTVRFSRTEDLEGIQAWMLVAEITAADGLPVELFILQRRVESPMEVFAPGAIPDQDEFHHVASLPDVHQYPVGAPDPEAGAPFFRVDTIELVFHTLDDLEATRDVIEQALQQLVNETTHLENVQEIETVTITSTI